jgi:dienelactone hydrolase
MTTSPTLTSPIRPGSPTIELTPNAAFADEELRVEVRGLEPGCRIVITAATEDDEGRAWRSEAQFLADASGAVKVCEHPSVGGTYAGASAMGLFWSMQLVAAAGNGSSTFAKTNAEPQQVRISARTRDRVVADAILERRFLANDTIVRDLTIEAESPDAGPVTVGRLFMPAGPGPHPVVIVLSGSGGGFDIDKAAVLSRHGFATFALGYFGIGPLPSWLNCVPLEYLEGAIDWLKSQPEIDAERIGVLGVSRGAELGLLLGSTFPAIRLVVAYAPSSVAWAASGRDQATGELIPCWTHRGEPIPFAPLPLRGFMVRSAFPVAALKRPVMFRNLFRAGLRNREAVRRAAIRVEKIHGPVLLVSGGDDHLWPAAEMSEAIVARLKQKKFPHPFEHLNYPAAGHMLRYPFLPTTSRVSSNKHLRGAKFSFGGNAQADAAAQADSWTRTISFLHQHL